MKELAVKLIVTLSLFLSFRFLFDHIKLISTQPNNYVKDEELERLKVREKINAYIEELNFKLTTLNKSSSNLLRKLLRLKIKLKK